MFQTKRRKSRLVAVFSMMELIYHASVQSVRKSHRNAFMALFMNMLQTITLVLTFYFMFAVLGMRGTAVRGDFMVYIMSGIFLYMTHIKAMGAVSGSEGPTSPMMQHAPMNTLVAIAAALVSSLYIQLLSAVIVLYIYHVAFTPVVLYDPIGCLFSVILAWFTGAAVGLVMLAIKPWAPSFVSIFGQIYQRANMIASGKMFLANTLPGYMVSMFDWNPLFHTIDQSRGFAFVNYNPHNSNLEYPIQVACVLVVIGMMLEFATRRNASTSWGAR